ncbi:MAG: hypothetical protein JW895_09785 [Thermoleophilaceae bacterium]|nr:hypothetical protein [Thermoleophilaceae bacterium]
MKRGVIAVLVPIALLLLAPLGARAQEAAPAAPAASDVAPAAISEEPQAAPAQDEPTTDEAPTNDLQGDDSDIPQQYTDPLAGEDDQNSGGQQGQEEAAPVTTAPAVQTTAAQLPQTGTPLGGVWIAGLLLLTVGAVLRFALRRREYPYPLPRY